MMYNYAYVQGGDDDKALVKHFVQQVLKLWGKEF